MKKIIKKIALLFSRFGLIIKSSRQILRRGGYAMHTIAVVNSSQRLFGKRILITGGGAGIGLAIAKKCLDEGAQVLIIGRNSSRLEKVTFEINNSSLAFLEWDITKTELISSKLDAAWSLLGGDIDMLVNNAGVILTTQFPEVTEKEWDYVYATNSRGLFFLTQALCKRWMENSRPRKILNISSQGGFVGATYPYRMTKWDVAGLTQGLGIKMAPHGIIVNGIAPGIIATEMQPDCLNKSDNIFCELNPLQRFAFPEEIAELAVFLLSDAANFIVGQTILCDGGFSLK